MFTFLLQERVTLLLKASTTSEAQAESGWLDLAGYQDVVCWTEITEASPGASSTMLIHFETSPSLDDAQFRAMVSVDVGPFPIGQVTANRVLAYNASVPLARYVRWRLARTGAQDARLTFRLVVSANCVDSRLAGAQGAA